MFIAINDHLDENQLNDSERLLLDSSISSNLGGIFIQMDSDGFFNKGSMHIKATLESDISKSVLVEVEESDTIKYFMKKIGERMESTYELYRNLRGVTAEFVIKKSNRQRLEPDELVCAHLVDGEEILFELQSNDLWIRVRYNLLDRETPTVYGSTEMRIDKYETLLEMKRKLQKFSMKLWSRMLKGEDQLYVIDSIDIRTKMELPNVNGEKN